jgi:hypothetical protein
MRFAEVDADANVVALHDLAQMPVALGAGLVEDDGRLYGVGMKGKESPQNGIAAWFDPNWAWQGIVEFPVATGEWTPYWPQGVMRVGNVYLVVHMERLGEESDWVTQQGDLFLSAFDLEWNLLDQVQLSHNTAPNGGMQPGFARKDDVVLALYAKDLHSVAYEVRIDLDACGAQDGDRPDDNAPDSGVDEDADRVDPPVARRCGCDATGGGASAGGVLGGALAWGCARRRRDRHAAKRIASKSDF